MKAPPITSISICMGSSCFSRGNSRNIQVIQAYLEDHPLPPGVEIAGHLCENQCCLGPNVTINDTLYPNVDSVVIIDLLQRCSSENE